MDYERRLAALGRHLDRLGARDITVMELPETVLVAASVWTADFTEMGNWALTTLEVPNGAIETLARTMIADGTLPPPPVAVAPPRWPWQR